MGRAWPGLAAYTWGASGLSQPSRPRAFPGGRRAGKEIAGFGYSGFILGGFWGFDGITHHLARGRGKDVATDPSAGRLSFWGSRVQGAWGG